ncbi:hypothetical protein QVD17_37255 [Tagetes erecta]|uniref:Uncharacterized protein n=1 Tax=Tagetes erecta TaxID=13708 RepID=A0AAD8NJP4_TARER|nr:hypothetical protein QVD17_37255 [Tagetes erecta]
MAGTDHVEWGMDFEEWERMDMAPPPPHLYVEQFDGYEDSNLDEEKKEVVKVHMIPSFSELFGLLVVGYHSNEVAMKGTKKSPNDHCGIGHQKRSVDLESSVMKLEFASPRCV